MFQTVFGVGRGLRFWWNAARWNAFGQSLFPALLALVLASGGEDFRLSLGLLAVFGALLAHTGANLLDDYFDFRSRSVQTRQQMIDGGMRARARKCSYLLSGGTTPARLFAVAMFCCVLAMACGAYLTMVRGWPIPVFAAVGGVLILFYSAPPLRLSFHGLGEFTVGLVFGPILMNAVAFAATGEVPNSVWMFSIPTGLLVANILYTHSIMDFEPDRRAGKITLAVGLGSPKKALSVQRFFSVAIFLSVLLGVLFGGLSVKSLLVFLTLPMGLELGRLMRLYVNHPERPVARRWWMGPMERWSGIQRAGIEWFMVRWFLARNWLVAFCLLAAMAAVWERWGT